jgi:hypothetical protein
VKSGHVQAPIITLIGGNSTSQCLADSRHAESFE